MHYTTNGFPTQVQRKMGRKKKLKTRAIDREWEKEDEEKEEMKHTDKKHKRNELILWCCWPIEVFHSTVGNDRFWDPALRIHFISVSAYNEKDYRTHNNNNNHACIHVVKCVFFFSSAPHHDMVYMEPNYVTHVTFLHIF